MLFTSMTFIFMFLPLCLLIFYISKDKYKNIVLLLFSLLFYSWGEPKYIILMLVSILVNYVLALSIDKCHKKKQKSGAKLLLILSIIFNLSFLFLFKYLNFTISNINFIFSKNYKLLNIILPIGISFYSFQSLSYVIDVYKKDVKAQKNIIVLGTYISLFPQLIAGPIVRYKTIEKQLINKKFSVEKFYSGVRRFIIGLSKKIIISNNVAILADSILDSKFLIQYGFIVTIIGVLSYTMQIYFDFSGYSDMAIGLGRMFGFEFLENFNYPYISKSITEFWRRWHISLSTWFRDYVYIPLGGNRVNRIRWILNLLIVWLLTGLWHGSSWNFVIWGLYFGLILILEKLVLSKILTKLPRFIQWIYSFLFINIGWIIFRSENLNRLKCVFDVLKHPSNNDILLFVRENYVLLNYLPYLILAFILSMPVLNKIKKSSIIINRSVQVVNIVADALLLILFLICICFVVSSNYNPFIYFRF